VNGPTGATIDANTGAFTWTPTESQGPGTFTTTVRVSDGTDTDEEEIVITVGEVNQAPVLAGIGNQTVNEGTQLSFTASATDADLPANTFTYSLVNGPTGATIDANTGAFTWTPTEVQGPGTFTTTVRVSDGTDTDEEEIVITVGEVNTAPVLGAIGNQSVGEGSQLTFTATATDTDIPANTFTYSLVNGPTGATIDANTGAFTWTPTEAQGPGTFTTTVRVSDGTDTDEEQIVITVGEDNTAPVLGTIGNQSVNEGSPLTFTASASDADLPAQSLTYSLVGTVPAGASINASTGAFNWTPSEAQGPGSFDVTVQVSDGTDTATETFTVTVNAVNSAPTGNVTIGGLPQQFQTLTANNTLADVDGTGPISYQWQVSPDGSSNWTDITGASSRSFTISDSQLNQYLRVRASYTDGENNPTTVDSASTILIQRVNALLWRNVSQQRVDVWEQTYNPNSNQFNPPLSITSPYRPNADWQVQAYADTDGDGDNDILWRNLRTGRVDLWEMNRGTYLRTITMPFNVLSSNWQLVSYRDMDGDGDRDLLWRNQADGRTDIWRMQNFTFAGSYTLGIRPGNLQIDFAYDADGDGDTDILWRNTQTGQFDLWTLQNGLRQATTNISLGTANTNWVSVGAADFSGDGRADLLRYNTASGAVALWGINANVLSSLTSLANRGTGNWQVRVTRDLNDDGRPDILWRNASTGKNQVWLVRDGSVISQVDLSDANSSWTIDG
jgi:hypothetical protein